jgi:hypothetical protein
VNYFAHGRNYIDDPCFLAGTALPDWLSVVDRRARARARLAKPWLDAEDRRLASLARGVVQHHHDDSWFHQTRAFVEVSLAFTRDIRQRLAEDASFRPSFLGHILVEILLDAVLIEQEPDQLNGYYRAMESLDPQVASRLAQPLITRPVPELPRMIRLFCRERFLCDYPDDGKLLVRLNRVMRRVRLPELPSSFQAFFPHARRTIRSRLPELLGEETKREQGEN